MLAYVMCFGAGGLCGAVLMTFCTLIIAGEPAPPNRPPESSS